MPVLEHLKQSDITPAKMCSEHVGLWVLCSEMSSWKDEVFHLLEIWGGGGGKQHN